MSIYQSKKLITALSPMDGVTDLPMRQITKKYGQPDFLFTEFLNVEGWHFAPERLAPILWSAPEKEGPVIAQIYGLTPQYFYDATLEICARGFFGVDLNFGCPARTVVHNGAGGGLIKTPTLAQEIFAATRQATLDYAQKNHTSPLPVSIKTRLGYDHLQLDDWLPFVLNLQPDLLTLHGRTLKQGYAGQADWQAIAQVVQLRDQLAPQTALFGNGDLHDCQQIHAQAAAAHVDGVLVGRAAIGNPWVFGSTEPTLVERARVALEHAQLFETTYQAQSKYSFVPMRKYLAAYISHFPEAKQFRLPLMQTTDASQVATILAPLLNR